MSSTTSNSSLSYKVASETAKHLHRLPLADVAKVYSVFPFWASPHLGILHSPVALGASANGSEVALKKMSIGCLATQEAEIRRVAVQSQPRQIVCETLFRKKKAITKIRLAEWLKV
jgi:hypothetical protein